MNEIEPGSTEVASTDRSVWQNFRDVVFEPSATFRDVADHPRWLAPLLLIAAGTLVVSFFLLPMYEATQEIRLAASDMPPEQREQAAQGMEAFKWIGLILAPLMYAIITALMALLFWAWAAISGARNAVYKVAFAALVYAGLVGFIQTALQAVVVSLKGAEQVAREGGPPLFGLSLFIERDDMSAILWGQLANINFFSIWYAVLVGIAGVHALKMSRGSATAMAIAFFVMWGFFTALQAPPAS